MSLDTILKKGEALYLEEFRDKLEKEFLGSYAVIDVDEERFVVSENKLKAFELAKETFGEDKLFFSVHIGELDTATVNFKENATPLSWAV
jgi:hypothetical protein